MKKKFLKSSIDIIKKSNPNISEEQIEIIEYGLEGIYLTFSKLIILIILSSILGILWQVILLSIFYAVLRCINSMWKRRRIIRKRQNYDDKEILIKKLIVIDFVNLQKGANNKCEKVRVGANY